MLKKFIFLIVLLAGIFRLEAQSWIQKANLPFAIQNSEGTCFSIADKVYIVCGVVNGDYSNFCWEYNTSNDTWTQKTSFPGCPRYKPSSFVIAGKGYFFGGQDTIAGTNNDLWEYDPNSDNWVQKTSLPGPNRAGAVGFAINGKGYITTGAVQFGVVLNDCWEYDPVTDSWTQKASMPATARTFGTGFAIGTKGYVGSGIDYSDYLRDWWEFDPALDQWAMKDSLIGGGESLSSFSVNGYGYAGPGFAAPLNQYSFFLFDPASGSWTQFSNFPGLQFMSCFSTSCQGKGYIISGSNFNGCQKSTWEFTPPVGIEEYEQHAISIFPNPANDILNLNYDLTNEFRSSDKIDFVVSDLSGKELIRKTIPANQLQMQISVSDLATGMYFCRIETETEMVYSRKFAVVRN